MTTTVADTPTNTAPGQTLLDMNLAYTSFQTVDSTAVTNFMVRCTNGLNHNISLTRPNGSPAGNGAGPTADGGSVWTDSVLGLDYTLNLTNSYAYAAGTNSYLGSETGSGTGKIYFIYGTIASGQVGTCANGPSCNNSTATDRVRYITVTF